MKIEKFKTLVVVLTALFCIVSVNPGGAKNVEDKIKDLIDDVSASLKKGVDALGDDIAAIQNYLDNYPWKGLIQDKASSGPATLKHLQLNGHPKVVAVKPGERIEGIVQCHLHRDKCDPWAHYRVVLGIKGVGPQTTIFNHFGFLAGESLEKFVLIAPSQPGLYEIRFKHVEAILENTAFDAWKDENGNEPDGTTTIGIIYVK